MPAGLRKEGGAQRLELTGASKLAEDSMRGRFLLNLLSKCLQRPGLLVLNLGILQLRGVSGREPG